MTHWGVEVMDLECVNGNWQMPAFPSSLMVCDVETGEALYPALGGAGGRTMSTVLTIAAVTAAVYSGGTSLAAMGATGKLAAGTAIKSGFFSSLAGQGYMVGGGMTSGFALGSTAMQGIALGSLGVGVAAGLSGGVTDMFAPPTPPPVPTFPAYAEAPGIYDPATEAVLNKEAQDAAYQERVSEFNRRRQRFVTMKDERQPLGGAGALVPKTAVHKQQLLGA